MAFLLTTSIKMMFANESRLVLRRTIFREHASRIYPFFTFYPILYEHFQARPDRRRYIRQMPRVLFINLRL